MAHQITQDCIGCTLCAKVCPVEAISGTRKGKHSINPIRCVDCGVCGRVCPKGAIVDDAGNRVVKLSRVEWPKPNIGTEDCSACGICKDICPLDCIEISKPAFKGDIQVFARLESVEKCVGCGLCEKACPIRVITMQRGENV